MTWLKQHPSWIIANTDKNLGPCVIELDQYIKDALVHLQNADIYEFLTEAEAAAEANRLAREVVEWIFEGKRNKALGKHEVNYLIKHTYDNCADPHGYFYLMYKVHKKTLSTRPVCSDCVSITNPCPAPACSTINADFLQRFVCIQKDLGSIDSTTWCSRLLRRRSVDVYKH